MLVNWLYLFEEPTTVASSLSLCKRISLQEEEGRTKGRKFLPLYFYSNLRAKLVRLELYRFYNEKNGYKYILISILLVYLFFCKDRAYAKTSSNCYIVQWYNDIRRSALTDKTFFSYRKLSSSPHYETISVYGSLVSLDVYWIIYRFLYILYMCTHPNWRVSRQTDIRNPSSKKITLRSTY